MLPSLLENLSKNIHESYPQKLFETGVVFSKGKPIDESINFAAVIAYKDTNYSEIKAIMQSFLKLISKLFHKLKLLKIKNYLLKENMQIFLLAIKKLVKLEKLIQKF